MELPIYRPDSPLPISLSPLVPSPSLPPLFISPALVSAPSATHHPLSAPPCPCHSPPPLTTPWFPPVVSVGSNTNMPLAECILPLVYLCGVSITFPLIFFFSKTHNLYWFVTQLLSSISVLEFVTACHPSLFSYSLHCLLSSRPFPFMGFPDCMVLLFRCTFYGDKSLPCLFGILLLS